MTTMMTLMTIAYPTLRRTKDDISAEGGGAIGSGLDFHYEYSERKSGNLDGK